MCVLLLFDTSFYQLWIEYYVQVSFFGRGEDTDSVRDLVGSNFICAPKCWEDESVSKYYQSHTTDDT